MRLICKFISKKHIKVHKFCVVHHSRQLANKKEIEIKFCSFEQFQLLIPQPVSVLEDISDQTTTENQSVTFQCRIQINYPEIPLTWYKGTQKLDPSDKYEISSVGDRHSLEIKNCQDTDQGNYRVVCGPHISNAKLAVAGKARRVSTSCPA